MTIRLIKCDDEVLIADAASICYDSNPKDKMRLIRACVKNGHHSVLEFADATFEIECSRACSHQLVRHRLTSIAQQSQRYVKSDEDTVVPPSIEADAYSYTIYEPAIKYAYQIYRDLVARGVSKEDARFVLPNAAMTKLRWKTNFREWRHIIDLRCDNAAQWEIREIALEILKILYELAPNTFQDLWEKYAKETS